jgi:hypothetical protein
MRLQRYLIEGTDTSSATNMELTLVELWNGQPVTYPELEESAHHIVKYLNSIGLRRSGKAEHVGDSKATITSMWKKYGGTDGTPKTDIIISKKRISLKKMGRSQIMSGQKGETSATFHTVLNDMNEDNELLGQIETWMDNMLIVTKNTMSITQQKQSGHEAIDFKKAEDAHKRFTVFLRDKFKNNMEFRNGVVREALTGKHKFGRGYPIADYVLVFGKDGKTNKWRDANDENYISEIASKTKIEVSWKSSYRKVESETGRNYTFFSVLRLAQNNLKTEMEKYEGQPLNEGLLTNLWATFKKWFAQLWKKVKNWLAESYENLLSFLELDGSVIVGSVEF